MWTERQRSPQRASRVKRGGVIATTSPPRLRRAARGSGVELGDVSSIGRIIMLLPPALSPRAASSASAPGMGHARPRQAVPRRMKRTPPAPRNPLAPKSPALRPRGPSTSIHLFMNGGPVASRYLRPEAGPWRNTHGQATRPRALKTERRTGNLDAPRRFQVPQEGQARAAIEVSDIFSQTSPSASTTSA